MAGHSHELLIFPCLIAHQDASGNVELHPRAIAAMTGLTEEIVRETLLRLEADDKESRTMHPEYGGRRIVRLDEHRPWGWFLVNSEIYRTLLRAGAMRENARLRQAAKRERDRHAMSRDSHGAVTSKSRQLTARSRKENEKENETEKEKKKKIPALPGAPVGASSSGMDMHGSLSVYAVAWEARYSTPPHPSARDCVAANAALKSFEPAIKAQLLAAYVADEDPWLCEKAHPLGLFPRQVDKLLARLNGKLSEGARASPRYVNPTKGFQEPGYNEDLDLTALAASMPRTVEE